MVAREVEPTNTKLKGDQKNSFGSLYISCSSRSSCSFLFGDLELLSQGYYQYELEHHETFGHSSTLLPSKFGISVAKIIIQLERYRLFVRRLIFFERDGSYVY
jgi:hypothetical protein